ncbi:MAG: hypothetical protein H6765_08045 [Candidatus Peribacteria bacterium]|nr:MAG: hypothetical protein H6765_08045 [Candidatus Peribacteria bacterium]
MANIGGVYTTLSYQALQQARYLSRQLSLSPNDDVEILLLCEDCGGR